MDGPTIHFFGSVVEVREELTWEKFKVELLERYGGIGDGNIFEQLTALRQDGDIEDYIQQFERLIVQVGRLPGEQYIGYFVHELHDGVRGKVQSLRALGSLPRTHFLNVTRVMDLETNEMKGNWAGSRQFGPNTLLGSGSRHRVGLHESGKGGMGDWVYVKGGKESHDKNVNGQLSKYEPKFENEGSMGRDRGICHLSYQQMVERRQKGLCFKCGGLFHPKHLCPDKQLRIMLTKDDKGSSEAHETETSEKEGGVMHLQSLEEMKSTQPHTLKLQGTVKGVPILLLVDSGAIHNFMSRRLAEKMGWSIVES
ncbi:uncharacterized protein LOC109810472 [Cajanus cajan]|uniref:uncharacterized protein LOC109810472 n=1 Tax=Cajanus cajan TaxID=3821 RepID=UPI00098D7B9D|nr:uncharacterized protein LOC109810472 [Cajanus cajan]